MTKKEHSCDVVIVGGGLTGLTLACALAQSHINTILVEKRDPSIVVTNDSDGRCSAIAYGSYRFFESINLWDAIAKNAGPILDIRVSDNDSKMFLHYDHQLVGQNPMGYMIENHHMLKAFYAKANTLDALTILAPAKVRHVATDETQATVTLQSGEEIHASLLCVADGKYSTMRSLLAVDTFTHHYQQTGIVCNIKHERDHEGIAQERFLPPGPFAVLPMAGGKHSSLVWTESTRLAPLYLELDDDEFLHEIAKRIGGYLGQISLASKRFLYPLELVYAKHYSGQRFALVGDAAHGIHPLAGQGFNLGIRDIEILVPIIAHRKQHGLDIGASQGLNDYASLRKFDSSSLVAITTGLNSLFCTNKYPIKLARRLGMAAVNKTPVIKKTFMMHAMGMR